MNTLGELIQEIYEETVTSLKKETGGAWPPSCITGNIVAEIEFVFDTSWVETDSDNEQLLALATEDSFLFSKPISYRDHEMLFTDFALDTTRISARNIFLRVLRRYVIQHVTGLIEEDIQREEKGVW